VTAALIGLGFLLGLRHALEPDHLSAVAALASRSARVRDVARVAGAWGLGHAAVLVAAGTALVWTGAHWPPALAATLELAAGAILVWLGVDVLRRAMTAPAIARSEGGGAVALATGGASTIAAPTFAARAFVIGGVHGVEGSGAVVLVALPSVHSASAAALYLGAFGIGSVAGMVACSFAVTLPLGIVARRFTGGARRLQLAVGVTSVAVGASMIAAYIRSIFT
jgi:sulfite exporter TauE/SafE